MIKVWSSIFQFTKLEQVPGHDLEQIVIGANWQKEVEPSFKQYILNSLDSIAANSVSKAWREASLAVCSLLEQHAEAAEEQRPEL